MALRFFGGESERNKNGHDKWSQKAERERDMRLSRIQGVRMRTQRGS